MKLENKKWWIYEAFDQFSIISLNFPIPYLVVHAILPYKTVSELHHHNIRNFKRKDIIIRTSFNRFPVPICNIVCHLIPYTCSLIIWDKRYEPFNIKMPSIYTARAPERTGCSIICDTVFLYLHSLPCIKGIHFTGNWQRANYDIWRESRFDSGYGEANVNECRITVLSCLSAVRCVPLGRFLWLCWLMQHSSGNISRIQGSLSLA